MRTAELLEQSQSLTLELQSQSEELRTQQEELKKSNAELEAQATTLRTSEETAQGSNRRKLQQVNEELEEKASLLAEQNRKVESKNAEVESARLGPRREGRPARAQLQVQVGIPRQHVARAADSAQQPPHPRAAPEREQDGNLTPKQVEFAQTILTSGSDLLNLINDVLDLSKVEAGKMDVNATDVRLTEVKEFVERSFSAVAEQKGLEFRVEMNPDLPQAITTDGGRLAAGPQDTCCRTRFKFTQEGDVVLTIRRAEKGRRFQNPTLEAASEVVAFAVADTGVGIARDKQKLIFEAFQQAEWNHESKIRRNGASGFPSVVRSPAAGRRDTSRERGGSGEHVHAFLPARYIPGRMVRSRHHRHERLHAIGPAGEAKWHAVVASGTSASATPWPS